MAGAGIGLTLVQLKFLGASRNRYYRRNISKKLEKDSGMYDRLFRSLCSNVICI